MSRKNVKKVISLEVVVVDSTTDGQKSREDVVIDVKISRDFTLQHIHDSIISILYGSENELRPDSLAASSNLQYFIWSPDDGNNNSSKDKEPLEMEKTLAQLNINDKDRLVAETAKRKKRARKSIGDLDNDEEDDRDTLSLVCTTRIFENEGWGSRKVRVLVKKQQSCSYLIDDVTALWNRSGLKFRYGRTVLNANKTFEELGIDADGEVVVTGARTA